MYTLGTLINVLGWTDCTTVTVHLMGSTENEITKAYEYKRAQAAANDKITTTASDVTSSTHEHRFVIPMSI